MLEEYMNLRNINKTLKYVGMKLHIRASWSIWSHHAHI